MSFFVKFVWGLVSTACKQTVGFAYGLRTLAKHATPQGLTPTVGTNHGHWEISEENMSQWQKPGHVSFW